MRLLPKLWHNPSDTPPDVVHIGWPWVHINTPFQSLQQESQSCHEQKRITNRDCWVLLQHNDITCDDRIYSAMCHESDARHLLHFQWIYSSCGSQWNALLPPQHTIQILQWEPEIWLELKPQTASDCLIRDMSCRVHAAMELFQYPCLPTPPVLVQQLWWVTAGSIASTSTHFSRPATGASDLVVMSRNG